MKSILHAGEPCHQARDRLFMRMDLVLHHSPNRFFMQVLLGGSGKKVWRLADRQDCSCEIEHFWLRATKPLHDTIARKADRRWRRSEGEEVHRRRPETADIIANLWKKSTLGLFSRRSPKPSISADLARFCFFIWSQRWFHLRVPINVFPVYVPL